MSTDAHADLRPVLAARLRAAMQARDDVAVAALRSILNAIDNATAVDVTQAADRPATRTEVPRRLVSRDELASVIRREAEEREDAAGEMDRLGLADRAARLRAEAAIAWDTLALTTD
jgi:uncharacterized protein YqeY